MYEILRIKSHYAALAVLDLACKSDRPQAPRLCLCQLPECQDQRCAPPQTAKHTPC